MLVDFDHTLFASNSTELFLASARPAFLASLLLGFVRGVLPWYLYSTRYNRLKDYLSVVAVVTLMPWTLLVWRRRGPSIFREHTTHALADALRQVPASRTVIVSFGIAPIIRALLRGSAWESCALVCMEVPCNPRQLVAGKASLIRKAMPCLAAEEAVFITDSEDDRDLLNVVAHPVLIPLQGRRLLADSKLYLPWRYSALGKYNQAWVLEQSFRIDLVLTALATHALWHGPALMIVAMLLLYVSLHAVYEIGYFENDFSAAARETKPTLVEGREMFRGFPLERHAWTWATILGIAGCLAAAAAQGSIAGHALRFLGSWAAVLVSTRLIFHWYNKQAEARRMLYYPFLQAAKYFGVFIILPAVTLGMILLASQVILMWMNYVVYRRGGRQHQFPREEIRLAAFVTLSAGMAVADPGILVRPGLPAVVAMMAWPVWRVARHYWQQRRRRIREAGPYRSAQV